MSQRKRDIEKTVTQTVPSGLLVVTKGNALTIEVFAKPRAKRSEVKGVREGALEVALAAPPVDGAANEELVRFLAEILGLGRKSVTLLRGQGSRTKLVELAGVSRDQVLDKLKPSA